MTTMFVQLRRVVYLLVLLHCCASVAYAESVKESAKEVVERRGDSLKKIEGDMEAIRTEALKNISDLENKLKVWKEDSERAKSVADEVIQMRHVLEAAMRNNGAPNANKGVVDASLAKGLLKNATDAVQRMKNTLSNARRSASMARELRNSCYDTFDKLNSLIWAHKSFLAAYLGAIAEAGKEDLNMTEEKKVASESQRKQKETQDVLSCVISAGKQCFKSERETNSHAVRAENAMRRLESLINQV
ncbi:uncharacterized protein TM35_000123280, partial [Trypanosoma theileri]